MTPSIEEPRDKWTQLGELLLLAAIGISIIALVAHSYLKATPAAKTAQSIVAAGDVLTIDGAKHKITTSEFTPKGTFTIGDKFFDKTTGVDAYPFLVTDWRTMNDRNVLKARIEKLEKATGQPQRVAYSIHAGAESYGCVVLSGKALDTFKDKLVGTRIEIR